MRTEVFRSSGISKSLRTAINQHLFRLDFRPYLMRAFNRSGSSTGKYATSSFVTRGPKLPKVISVTATAGRSSTILQANVARGLTCPVETVEMRHVKTCIYDTYPILRLQRAERGLKKWHEIS